MGTYGYSAPEYVRTGNLTLKSDVYSFGVVLLELITGRRAVDTTKSHDEQNLVSWAQPIFRDPKKYGDLADPNLGTNYPEKDLNQVVAIAAMCLQEESAARPLMSDVVTALSSESDYYEDENQPDYSPQDDKFYSKSSNKSRTKSKKGSKKHGADGSLSQKSSKKSDANPNSSKKSSGRSKSSDSSSDEESQDGGVLLKRGDSRPSDNANGYSFGLTSSDSGDVSRSEVHNFDRMSTGTSEGGSFHRLEHSSSRGSDEGSVHS
ncbi:hypothetical protein TSUD_347030 [Trifolium subterraneum]|nr:hypothetical protein TSUD_347030 [Trifolium subterraneum]